MLTLSRLPEKDVLIGLLQELWTADNRPAVFQAFSRAMEAIGFNGAMLVSRTSGTGWQQAITETTYPAEWIAHYVERNYTRTDPSRRFCLRTTQPFFWSELAPYFRKKEMRIFDEARAFGLCSGMSMPIYVGGLLAGGLGLSSASPRLDDLRLKPTLTMAAQMFWTVYSLVPAGEDRSPAEPPAIVPMLTKREHEVVTLLAAGWSNPQIADTLHISQSAVEYHLKNVFAKLGVDNRVSAVVKAMRLGIVCTE